MTIKVMTIFGTRPEAIKMAPVVKALEEDSRFSSTVVITGQHRKMLDQVLDIFKINSNYDLSIMTENQTLTKVTSEILLGLESILKKEKPDIVLVHGDTTTTYTAAMAAFYQQIKIGHVEAGLRTWNKYSPFPEEINRQMIDILSDFYFAPTEENKKNLLIENHKKERIFVTGNTVVDALRYTIKKDYKHPNLNGEFKKRIILTMHRRENLGSSMKAVFEAMVRIAKEFPEVNIIFPMHKNPKVRKEAELFLSNLDNISLIEPLDVSSFHNLINISDFILTDSGGIQEEACSLGVPVLVLREETERPEGIDIGILKLIGTNQENVYQETKNMLTDMNICKNMIKAKSPYGDGNASKEILEIIFRCLK